MALSLLFGWWFRVAGCPCQRYLYAGVPGPHFLGGQQDGYVLGRAGALDTVLLCLSFPDSAGVAGGCAAAGRTCASSTVSAGSSEPRGVELGARGGRPVARPYLLFFHNFLHNPPQPSPPP